MTRQRTLLLVIVALATLVAVPVARAHFRLEAPAAYSEQGSLGDPQKTGPCGPSGTAFTPTNAVTAVKTGTAITVTIDETIFHEGHYRVSIAQDQAGLPPEPVVTAPNNRCMSAEIDPNPSLPVLADGVLVHTSPFGGTQTVQIPLPAGMTCTNCVVQVLEFMAGGHPTPCFYHHCATVTVADDAPPPPDGGVIPGDDAGVTPPPGTDPAGGCCDSGGSPATGLFGALLVGLLAFRRRR